MTTMTTNSPNPFVGDVQVLIADCLNDIEEIQYEISTYGDESGRRASKLKRQQVALVALMGEPCGYHGEGALDVDPVWPTPYGVGFRVQPKPQGIYNIPVFHAPPVQVLRQADLPKGWKLVPVEPTWEMLSADGCTRHHDDQDCMHHKNRKRIWKAMLAAAPDNFGENGPI
ncbi:hypothetical protein [Pantoea ananatis]|uniref:hypothetical protein n=1 Tax=Pantoea ananas TaxID=553 RepID=UPI0021E7C202|nr:hypothetical protein [Pantoea ananatis]MCV3301122.1 hypothetical protein [Pantoea ananatis]